MFVLPKFTDNAKSHHFATAVTSNFCQPGKLKRKMQSGILIRNIITVSFEETDVVADEEEALLSMLSLNFYHAVFPLTWILIPPLQKLSRAKSPTHPKYSPYSEYAEVKWSSRRSRWFWFPFCRWRENGVATIPIKSPFIFAFFCLGLGRETGPTNQPQQMCMPHGRKPPSTFSATDTDNRIPLFTDVRDLGVPFDTTFTASAHCIEAANTARQLLFLVRRSFCELSKTAFTPLYCALVRPHLEYAMEANDHSCIGIIIA